MGLATDRTAAENPYSAPGLNLYAGNGLDYALLDLSGAGLGAPGQAGKLSFTRERSLSTWFGDIRTSILQPTRGGPFRRFLSL